MIYDDLNKTVRKRCQRNKEQGLRKKEEEAQAAANMNDARSLYCITHEIANTRRVSGAPIKSKDGRTLTKEDEQNVHWVEHFREVLNHPIPPISIDKLEAGTPLEVKMGDITTGEVHVAVKCLQNNKAPGLDEICRELLRVVLTS